MDLWHQRISACFLKEGYTQNNSLYPIKFFEKTYYFSENQSVYPYPILRNAYQSIGLSFWPVDSTRLEGAICNSSVESVYYYILGEWAKNFNYGKITADQYHKYVIETINFTDQWGNPTEVTTTVLT